MFWALIGSFIVCVCVCVCTCVGMLTISGSWSCFYQRIWMDSMGLTTRTVTRVVWPELSATWAAPYFKEIRHDLGCSPVPFLRCFVGPWSTVGWLLYEQITGLDWTSRTLGLIQHGTSYVLINGFILQGSSYPYGLMVQVASSSSTILWFYGPRCLWNGKVTVWMAACNCHPLSPQLKHYDSEHGVSG